MQKIILILGMALFSTAIIYGLSIDSNNTEDVSQEINEETSQSSKMESIESVEVVINSAKVETVAQPVEIERSHLDEDKMIHDSLERLDQLVRLPTAGPLVEEVVARLESNPALIDYSSFAVTDANAQNTVLGEDYLEKMIPDQEFRAIWIKMLEAIKNDLTRS